MCPSEKTNVRVVKEKPMPFKKPAYKEKIKDARWMSLIAATSSKKLPKTLSENRKM